MPTTLTDRLAPARGEDGFTLIELMVVVLIIAVLLAIAIPTFLGAQGKAKDRNAQSSGRNALTAANTIYADTGQFGVYLGTREENLAECLRIVSEQVEDIAESGPGKDELARAKENLKGRILLSLESTSARMTRLGKSTVTDTPLLTPEQVVKRLEAVSAGEVAELADALLATDRLSIAGIGPDEAHFAEAAERVNPALAARAA